jgi:hypothetical protein
MDQPFPDPPKRTPQFVSREIGAFELCVDVKTWDELVKLGRLPPCVPGFARFGLFRWAWKDIENLALEDVSLARRVVSDGGVAGAANIGKKKKSQL